MATARTYSARRLSSSAVKSMDESSDRTIETRLGKPGEIAARLTPVVKDTRAVGVLLLGFLIAWACGLYGVKSIRAELGERALELDQKVRTVRNELSEEAQQRKTADAETQHQLEDLAVGGLHLEWVGLTWLIVVTLATSLPAELVPVLGWLF